jgi:C4-dicarboxylate transporter DctM subunit
LAIPFFILAAEFMVFSGTAERLLKFTSALVGHWKGGLAYVNIYASMLFGGCSGSAIADVAGLGVLEINMMEKAGYDKAFSTALTITSSVQGPIIPPSIMMVLIGATTGTSIGALLVGGAIPGVMVGLAQSVVVFLIGKKGVFPDTLPKTPLKEKIQISVSAIPFIMMPFIIIFGIIFGFFTPTEASAIAVAYGILLILVYKHFKIRLGDLMTIIKRSVLVTASILMLSGASNIFGWILATEKIPNYIAGLLLSVSGNKYVILIIINVFLLLWGMIMDSLPAIMILAPILFPVAAAFNINQVHFGVMMGFNLAIGLITPPYGAALFTGTIVSGVPMEKLIRHMLPFILASIVILVLITYFPNLVTFLPQALGLTA